MELDIGGTMILLKIVELLLAILAIVRIIECVDKILPTKPKGVGPWITALVKEFFTID